MKFLTKAFSIFISASLIAIMAMTVVPAIPVLAAEERYFAATGNYNDVNTWSATDGGAVGATVPTSANNVHFTANSNGKTLTVNVASSCLDMVADTGNTATLAGSSALNIYGSLTFHADMTKTYSGVISFRATAAGKTITATGPLACELNFAGVNGGWTFQDSINIGAQQLSAMFSSINTNGQTVTCGTFYSAYSGGNARTITFGASVINCTEFNMVNVTNLTLNEGTSSIRVTGTGAFAGGGETYYEVQLNGTAHTISGSNTFTNLILKADTTQTITFTDGTTQIVTTPTLTGSVGKVKTLQGSSTGGWIISKASGTVSVSYCTISYSTATGGAEWLALTVNHNVDGGSNVGWIFTITPGAPIGFTLTDLGGSTITANWAKGLYNTYTLVRISRNSYPSTNTSGEWLYYDTGTSVNITGWPLETTPLYVSAWGVWTDNATYSTGYATATLGGAGMLTIGIVVVVLGLTILAFVLKNALLHMVCVVGWLLFGFYMWNLTWPEGNTYLPMAVMLLALSMVIVHLIYVVNYYLGLRTEPPTHDNVQDDYRKKVLNVTRRKEPREW